MQSIRKTVLINQSALKMFRLIDDVEHYAQFLPWCGDVTIHEHTDAITDVTIQIRYFGLNAHFRTRNNNIVPTEETPGQIDMHFVDGPFRSLVGQWQIIPLDANACKIIFSLDYEFASSMLEKVIGPVFNKIAATFVDAFVKQAEKS